jgi:4-hydroxy-tetrahydrodipicolinate synthase
MDYSTPKLWTALITPMKDDGSVDYATLKKLVAQQESAGNGILVLGSTGEALNLSQDEKKEIYEFVKNLSPKVPLMAGIGGINLEETKRDLRYLERLDYDCYLMVTPLYAKPGVQGQIQWFTELMNEATKPSMLYNVPGRTGISLHREALETLKNHPNFWSIKEASGSTKEFQAYVETVHPAPVFSGDDAMLPDYASLGAKGLVSVASNAWPKETNNYVAKALNGTLTNAGDWKAWADSLFIASNPIPVKRMMFETGAISSPICRAPLTHEEISDSQILNQTNTSVTSWVM